MLVIKGIRLLAEPDKPLQIIKNGWRGLQCARAALLVLPFRFELVSGGGMTAHLFPQTNLGLQGN